MSDDRPDVLLVAARALGDQVRCRGRGCQATIWPGEMVHDVGYDDGARMWERATLCDACVERLGTRVRPCVEPRCVPDGPLIDGQW